ncbi:hypothetical protein ACRALDRAFT_1061838 [Sodiomyces alcalophilus JCM 7366]|uniref:uncharacterized protein n=1 Tax=Sodiomyces alcalophilus JCM 7366 TaxID=591952 RepID=UPI0039B3D698
MTSPYQSGSQDAPGSTSSVSNSGLVPQRRFPYSSVAAGTPPGSTPPYITHPGRVASVISQLLNAADDSGVNSPSAHFPNSSRNSRTGSDEEQNGIISSTLASGPAWTRNAQFASLSKAVDIFTNKAVLDENMLDLTPGFFTPSYLRGSAFMERLIEAHRAEMRTKKETHGQGRRVGNLSRSTSSAKLHDRHPSHRGLSYDVVEKPPPIDQDKLVSPLPSRWNNDDKHGALELSSDGMEVKCLGPKGQSEREREAYAIRADHYIPPQCGLYYYEVTILAGKKEDTVIGVGFSGKSVALSRPPGWEPESYGYHGDDGLCYAAHIGGKTYGPSFSSQDVIGCGINFRTGCAFYTKNGVLLGTAFKDIKGKFYPSVGLKRTGEHLCVNFGQLPFTYDIDSMMAKEKETIQAEIEKACVSNLSASPAMKETDFIQALVLQFLQHDGYVETARAFSEELRDEKKALSLDPNATIEDINVRDDEHAAKRQQIRKAVLEGDIDTALKQTNEFYPDVLKDNEMIYFRLRCRKFVEMVRTAAEMRSAMGADTSNGHVGDDLNDQEMDLDVNGAENGTFDRMETEAVMDTPKGLQDLESQTLDYGRTLQMEYSTAPQREVANALGDIYALLAYQNPLEEKEVSHLLDKQGRVIVAEELNSAILLSLGQSSRAAIEEMYAQTSVLLDDLRENGGDGAFVSLREVIDVIPKTHSL